MSTDQLFAVLAVVLVVLGTWKVVMSGYMDYAAKGYGVLAVVVGFLVTMLTQ